MLHNNMPTHLVDPSNTKDKTIFVVPPAETTHDLVLIINLVLAPGTQIQITSMQPVWGQHPEHRHANTTADNSSGTKQTTQSSSTKSFYNSKKNHHSNAVVVEPGQGVKFLPGKTGKCEINALRDTCSCSSFIPSRLVD